MRMHHAMEMNIFIVSKEDIEALLASKILAGDFGGEYGIFIMMEANNDQ